MREDRLFPEGTIPEYTQAAWYAERETAPHVDEAMHRPRLELAAEYVRRVWMPGMTVVDLGAGDGGFLSLLDDTVLPDAKWGYDLQQTNVDAAATRNQDVQYGDVLSGAITWGDIAVATEMLEHLVDPHAFVQTIAEHARYLVASSPWNETLDAHYGFHTWAWDVEGYLRLLTDHGWRILANDVTGMFHVVLAEAT